MKIEKRNGQCVEFCFDKVMSAVERAFADTGEKYNKKKVKKALERTIQNTPPSSDGFTTYTVEQIQDIVENVLMKLKYYDTAKSYVRYRYLHELERQKKNDEKLADKIFATNVQNQNANIDEKSFGGRLGEAADLVLREYALEHCLSPMAKSNHLNNEIYIHDLGHYVIGDHNCLSIPFDDLLANGFNTRQTDVRPANSISTAFQLVAVIFQLQSLMNFGGVSATHIDWTMVPYVRKSFAKHFYDGMMWCENANDFANYKHIKDYNAGYSDDLSIDSDHYKEYSNAYDYAYTHLKKEIHQAVEGMYHNLNTLQSRSGNQLPFTSINYGTCTLPEGRLVIEALLNVSIEGLGRLHKTSIFPCGVFQSMEGVNRKPEDPNYDMFQLALKSTSLRLYPNYANVEWSGNAGFDRNDPKTYFSTMGCRTANGWDINGMGQTKDGRGNICPVTIILPTLAMEAEGDVEKFMELLDVKIHEAKDMLIERFEYIASQSADSAKFMYENGTMAGYIPEEGIRSALRHGTLACGQLGLAETLQILIGCDHTEPAGMELAKRIEQLFKDRCAEFKEQYKLNIGVYYSPAENLCYTAMKKFKEKYGEIPNVSDREYFTNSIHVPVWKEVAPFDKIDIEAQLTGYSSAGCITYVELDSDAKDNLEALETLVLYAMEKDIPYFAINVPNDMCLECGFTDKIDDVCPKCGSDNIQRLRRVTGYLTGNYTTAFNPGKQAETRERISHNQKTE